MSENSPKHRTPANVLVTGGSRGIGRATVEAFARRGACVHTCATNADALTGLAEAHASVVPHVVDVTDREAVSEMVRQIEAKSGSLDCLVNNAGVLGPRAPLAEVSFEQWKKTIDVNVHGAFNVSQACLDLLAPASIVINISSSVGRRGRGEWGPYAVSKHGLEGLTDVLADELRARNITVVSLNPGGTATDMRREAYPDEDPDTLPQPDDVARTIVLLSECLSVAQTGKKYDARDLFGFAGCLD